MSFFPFPAAPDLPPDRGGPGTRRGPRPTCLRLIVFGLAVLSFLPGAVWAEPLTFDDALARVATAPELQASDFSVAAAQSSARAAGRLPDPELSFGIDSLPVTGPLAGRFGDEGMTMARVGLMQAVPSRARRRAEQAVAAAEIDTAQAEGRLVRRDARSAAGSAWIDLYYASERRRAVVEILAALEPLWDAAPAGVVSGADRPATALAPVRLRAALEDRLAELRADEARARAELARWTGAPSPDSAGPPPQPTIDAMALRASLDRVPAIRAYEAAGALADANVDLARAGRRPDWAFELEYGRRDPMFGDMISVGARVSLPLFADQRQEPMIAARASDATRIRVEREAALRRLRAQLESDLADHVMRQEQWRRARDVLLPDARRRSDLETASYGAGRAGLAEVLEAFTAVADVRLETLDREAAAVRAAVRLTLVYGNPEQ